MEDPSVVTFEDLVASCAERLDTEGEAALTALCEAHPRHAVALRQAMAPLLAFGVVGPTGEQPSAPPERLGEFENLREIGRGGMGVVYQAQQRSLDRTVALKVLPTAWVLDQRQVTRFQNEARAAATLDHPHIVRVYVVGTEAGTHFYAMQLIEGVSMRRLLHELRGAAPPDGGARAVLAGLHPRASAGAGELASTGSGAIWVSRAADLARQAATALAKAHEVGILHRDIKPGNLLVDRSGHLWVTDFGLAHFVREASDLTRSGEFVGTLSYSSPEQIGGRVTVDARSDVYSLGATLYELLTLRPPFAANDHAALVRQVVSEEPRPVRELNARVPRDLETIVHKAMAKEPTGRYQTAEALAEDLNAFLEGRAIQARPITAMQRGLRWCYRNPTLAAALIAILLLTVVASAVGYVAVRTARERDRAVTAEFALSRLSSQHMIASRRENAESLRRGLAAGRRLESLRLLREATAEIPSAAATPRDRDALRAQLRSEVLESLTLWDATPERIPGTDGATCLGFDGSFSWCAALQGGNVLVRDASGVELARLPQSGPDPYTTFSPDAEWLAIGNKEGLRLWHWRSGRVHASPGPPAASASCFDRHGRMFVACLERNRFVACDLTDGSWRDLLGSSAQQIASYLERPWWLELSPDGQSLAACHRRASKLLIYDIAQDRSPREIALPDHPITCLWHADGRRILVGGRFHDLLTVDVEAGTVVGAWPGHHAEVAAMAWSHGGDLLASSGWDGQVCVWDRHGRALVSLVMSVPPPQLRFTSDDRAVGWTWGDDAGRPIRWNLHRPAVLRQFSARHRPHSNIPWVAFHPTARLLAASVIESVLLYDSESGELLGELPLNGAPRRVRFLEDGSLMVAVAERDGCRVYPVKIAGNEIRVGPPRTWSPSINLREADAQGGTLCTWDGERIRTSGLDDRELASIEAPLQRGVHLRLAPGGRYAALGTFGGDAVAVWDLATGQRVLEVPALNRSATVAFAPDGRWAVVSRGEEHRVFEMGSWRQVAAIPRRRVDAVSGYGTFSADGSLLALPTTRSRLQVCETATFTPLFELEVPDGSDTSEPTFSPDGGKLALVSTHRSVFVWDLREAREELRVLGLDWSDKDVTKTAPPRERLRLVIE